MNRLDLDDTKDRLLGRCLRRQAEKIPDRDFIVWDREHLSYGLVNERANASARAFAELGVGPGDTVSFFLETGPEWVWATLGLNKLGAIWVGGSYETRFKNIAVWNSLMKENDYLVKRWTEFLSA